jgi:hypothetical protein
MKQFKYFFTRTLRSFFLLAFFFLSGNLMAQDSIAKVSKSKPVRNTFSSVLLIDNQTVMIPIKGTFEFDIQHRFGTVKNGRKDVWGILAPSNIRLGFAYTPLNKLRVGVGMTKERIQFDFNFKYGILEQTKNNSVPLSASYYGNMTVDARDKSNFLYGVNRLSYFSQLILARKFTEKFSAQVAPSLSWFNNVEAYIDSKGEAQSKMDNANFSVAVSGRFMISPKTAIIAGYDQPLTENFTNNPQPNLSVGIELSTSSHAFQIFVGNYYGIVPQSNNVFNQNDYRKGQFLIGFNMTRLWNF